VRSAGVFGGYAVLFVLALLIEYQVFPALRKCRLPGM
jgi:hypothetical protein